MSGERERKREREREKSKEGGTSACMITHVTSLYFCSLPKHKVSGQIKGFAFIEYSTEKEAKAALEVSTSSLITGM